MFKLYCNSSERTMGSTKSLHKTHIMVSVNIKEMAIMSTRMENQLLTPEFIMMAVMLLFRSSLFAKMKSFYLLNARIVLVPVMLSPRRPSRGDLVVLLILCVSLSDLIAFITSANDMIKTRGNTNTTQYVASIATTIIMIIEVIC